VSILQQINEYIEERLMGGKPYPDTFYIDEKQQRALHKETYSPSLKEYKNTGFIQFYDIEDTLITNTPGLLGMFNKVKVVRKPF
jgi:hypothetical protein